MHARSSLPGIIEIGFGSEVMLQFFILGWYDIRYVCKPVRHFHTDFLSTCHLLSVRVAFVSSGIVSLPSATCCDGEDLGSAIRAVCLALNLGSSSLLSKLLNLSKPHWKIEKIIRFPWELNEIKHLKCLLLCLACSKHTGTHMVLVVTFWI